MPRLFKPMNKQKTSWYVIIFAASLLVTSACADSVTSVGVRGYNHMKELWIHNFDVNGSAGRNVSLEGGGGENCCVNIPIRG